MTPKDKETIQRMLGKIEGVAEALNDIYAKPIKDAVKVIDRIIDKEKGGD